MHQTFIRSGRNECHKRILCFCVYIKAIAYDHIFSWERGVSVAYESWLHQSMQGRNMRDVFRLVWLSTTTTNEHRYTSISNLMPSRFQIYRGDVFFEHGFNFKCSLKNWSHMWHSRPDMSPAMTENEKCADLFLFAILTLFEERFTEGIWNSHKHSYELIMITSLEISAWGGVHRPHHLLWHPPQSL